MPRTRTAPVMPFEDLSALLDVNESAEAARTSPYSIRRAHKSGELAYYRIGKRHLTHPADLAAWVAQRRVQRAAS